MEQKTDLKGPTARLWRTGEKRIDEMQDSDLNNIAELGTPMSLIGRYDNKRGLSPALSLSKVMGIWLDSKSDHAKERRN